MCCPTLKELPAPAKDKTGWPWTEEGLQTLITAHFRLSYAIRRGAAASCSKLATLVFSSCSFPLKASLTPFRPTKIHSHRTFTPRPCMPPIRIRLAMSHLLTGAIPSREPLHHHFYDL